MPLLFHTGQSLYAYALVPLWLLLLPVLELPLAVPFVRLCIGAVDSSPAAGGHRLGGLTYLRASWLQQAFFALRSYNGLLAWANAMDTLLWLFGAEVHQCWLQVFGGSEAVDTQPAVAVPPSARRASEVTFASDLLRVRVPLSQLRLRRGAFVATQVGLGHSAVAQGKWWPAPVEVGWDCFVGNRAVLLCGARVHDENIVGSLTVISPAAPDSKEGRDVSERGQTWFGVPALCMPTGADLTLEASATAASASASALSGKTVESGAPDSALDRWIPLWQRRTLTVSLGLLLGLGYCGCAFLALVFGQGLHRSLHAAAGASCCTQSAALLFSSGGGLTCYYLCALALAPLTKRVLCGRDSAGAHRHDSAWWVLYAVSAAARGLSMDEPFACWAMRLLAGSPWAACMARALGAQVGQGAWLEDPFNYSEHDLLRVGSHALVERAATLQPHTFEHRLMRLRPLEVADECHVGGHSVLLPGCSVGARVQLHPNTLVMRQQVLRAHSTWAGSPPKQLATMPADAYVTASQLSQ
jgi:carbonic anhydrase/acetyltransferase-like protein (isoleucine patch superfamily)